MSEAIGSARTRQEDSHANSQSVLVELLAVQRRIEAFQAEGVAVQRQVLDLVAKISLRVCEPIQPPGPLVKKRRRLASEVERNEREQRACLALRQIGPNKTKIADFIGCSRATLDAMPQFCKLFKLMAQPTGGPVISDQVDLEGAKRKRYRSDRADG
jgi:hypothetical protein